jgi:hypothetical protein
VVEGRSNILEIPRDIFNALTKFHKVDNGAVRQMTQAEADILITEEIQASAVAENKRVSDLDGLLQTDLSGLTLTKIDQAINNIGSLSDAKVFLKRLCRYILKFTARRE